MIIMTKKEFENIYCQYYAKMYLLARTMLYDADESKDVVSEIFARLLRDGDRPQKDKMEGYLMTAVRNRCRDVLSHKSMQERVEKLFLQESMQSQLISMNDDDRLERLMQFIGSELPPLSQQIFRLRFLSEHFACYCRNKGLSGRRERLIELAADARAPAASTILPAWRLSSRTAH